MDPPRRPQILFFMLQNSFLSAATGKALTIVRAGLALTTTTLPNTSLLPAFVAGFVRSLNLHKPGTQNTPVFLVSAVAVVASTSRAFDATDFLISHAAAKASAMAPLVIAFAATFIGAMPM